MSQISRQHADLIVDGLTAHAADVSDELNSLVNESNGQDTRISAIEGGSLTGDLVTEEEKNNFLWHAATITATSTGSSVITTDVNHNITNGDVIKYALGDGGVLDTGLSVSLSYYGRSLTSKTFSYHPTYLDAINGTNAITVTLQGSGTRYLIAKPQVFSDGDLFVDGQGAKLAFNGVLQPVLILSDLDLRIVRGLTKPKYASATTFTQSRISDRDSGNKILMQKITSTTVDITTTGLNGIAQSANLTGTVSVTSGSDAITFSNSQNGVLQAGDVLVTAGGQARKLLSVSGTSAVAESQFATTETTVTFKRGGRCSFYTAATSGTVGTCHYYPYAISNGTTTGIILSTRNVAKGDTLVDLPAGYTYSKLLPYAITLYNVSTGAGVYVGNIFPFVVGPAWPYTPLILYSTSISYYDGSGLVSADTVILSGGSSGTFTAVDASKFIPEVSRMGLFGITLIGSATGHMVNLRPTGSTAVQLTAAGYANLATQGYCETDANRSVDYQKSFGATGTDIYVKGYLITELA